MTRELRKKRNLCLNMYADYENKLIRTSLLPIMKEWGIDFNGCRLLDVGCGAGGTTEAFYEEGAIVSGLDIDPKRISVAMKRAVSKGYPISYCMADGHKEFSEGDSRFKLLVIRDVIEHVANPLLFMQSLLGRLSEEGMIFVSFPPYYSAYGGHQHHPQSVTRFMPWSHVLLPNFIFNRLLPMDREYRESLASLNRITISGFERIAKSLNLKMLKKQLYVIRPCHHFKYGFPTLKSGAITSLPIIREVMISGVLYLLGKSH